MNPNYCRIRLPMEKATRRLCDWLGKQPLEPPVETDSINSVALACDSQGHWRGCALFVYQKEGWTIFEDLSGCLSFVPIQQWLSFAGRDEFFLAGYNDAILVAELIVISDGTVLREFREDVESPEVNMNIGKLPGEDSKPIRSWVEVASIVDDDKLAFSKKGWLWIF